jgi:hypothetical protein
MYDNSNNNTISYGSNYLSLMSLGGQQHQQSFNDSYTALILEESEKLYNKIMTELTNRVMAATAVAIRTSSLPLLTTNNKQKLTYGTHDETEESRYNNQNRNLQQ